MRLENVKRDVSSSGTMEVAKATIKATPKIFDMFANDTYANKPVAIMRELVANGVDAHVAAGRADRPVEVHLPTELEPTCRIRDFGTGMSHDFVMGPFMAYTDGSTKDKNDDAIGGFGIGSKSPFAYVDQFTLRVVHQGVLSVYTMFKDEDGIPAIGLQAQTTTDEPNGVEVSFPVEDEDMLTFREAAQEALQYFQPLPLVPNGTVYSPEYTYVGNSWAMRPKAGELGVIMGGVRYPCAKNSLTWAVQNDKEIAPLLGYGLDITLPIGSCGVAMSREQLSYVPKTSESISKALHGILEDVVKTFANYFDGCATEWEAMEKLLTETGATSYNRSGRAQLLLANAKFQGKKLETGFRLSDAEVPDARAWLIQSKSGRRGSLCPTPKWGPPSDIFTVTPGQVECVIIDDLPFGPKSKAVLKIKNFVNSQPQAKAILVFRGRDGNKHDVKALINMLRGPTNIVYTSTLPEPVAAPKAAKNVRPRVRMFSHNGKVDAYTQTYIRNLSPAHSKQNAIKEIAYVDQPANGIMVVMNSFDLPSDFYTKMFAELVRYDELVFVNSVDVPKLKTGFDDFEEVFQKRLDKALVACPELPTRLAIYNHAELSEWFHLWGHILVGKIKLTPAQRKRPFGKIVELYDTYIKPLSPDQLRLAPFVTAEMPKGFTMPKLSNDIHLLAKRLNLHEMQEALLFAKHL
jgi:Histidine kinase-, DNA gyrase B-, and HSP90-like ATPase